jgi:mannose-6-phosphate isomerase-like protein (cupin superfamily)
MNRLTCVAITTGVLTSMFALGRVSAHTVPTAATLPGSIIEHDSLVAVRQPGPHRGGGETTAYSFFAKVNGLPLVFRKRALHPGSAIGYHEQREDEIYYVLSGTGELTLDDTLHVIGPGTAVLTRPGSSHSLRQTGPSDLVILIAYPAETELRER